MVKKESKRSSLGLEYVMPFIMACVVIFLIYRGSIWDDEPKETIVSEVIKCYKKTQKSALSSLSLESINNKLRKLEIKFTYPSRVNQQRWSFVEATYCYIQNRPGALVRIKEESGKLLGLYHAVALKRWKRKFSKIKFKEKDHHSAALWVENDSFFVLIGGPKK